MKTVTPHLLIVMRHMSKTWSQGEIRCGALSEVNYNFLHGLSTSVPGSFMAGKVTCGNPQCERLAARTTQPAWKKPRTGGEADTILEKECEVCKAERKSRARVASGPGDERFQAPQFAIAPAIFPNNDTKYHTNKLRARQFAQRKTR